MNEKKFLKYFFIILAFILITLSTGWARDGEDEKIEPVILITKPLSFDIPGSGGFFREIEPVRIKVIVGKGRYNIKFEAGTFAYAGAETNGNYELNACFWIDNPKNTFSPGKPLILHIANIASDHHQTKSYEMALYGGITIQHISDHLSGPYEGRISVSVTEGL